MEKITQPEIENVNFEDLSVTERLYHYIVEIKHRKRNPFYDQTGLSNGTLDRKSGMNTDSILKVLNFYPDLNVVWLITGKGEPEVSAPQHNQKVVETKVVSEENLKDKLIRTMDKLETARQEVDDWKEEVAIKNAEIIDLKKKIKDLEKELATISTAKNVS